VLNLLTTLTEQVGGMNVSLTALKSDVGALQTDSDKRLETLEKSLATPQASPVGEDPAQQQPAEVDEGWPLDMGLSAKERYSNK